MPEHDDRLPSSGNQQKPGFLQWLRSLFSKRVEAVSPVAAPVMRSEPAAIQPEVDRETLREQQNDWIKARYKEWQLAWHDIFDQDQTLRAKGDFERPTPLPDDIDSDYRLIFGLFHAEQETRKRCFAMLPNGEEMHRRFEAFVTGRHRPIPEDEARQLVAELERSVDAAGPDEKVDWSQISVVNRRSADADEILSGCSSVDELFSENLLELTPENQLPALAARLFLSEPLYAAAGNSYELHNWVTGISADPRRDKVFELLYRLNNGGWQLFVSESGVVMAFGR